jgi:hypothetical protein
MNLDYAGKMPVYDLDFDVLTGLLVQIPLSSLGLRHTSIQSSLDYIHPADGNERELQFIKDFLALGTDDMMERWYGGHDNAHRHVAEVMDDCVSGLRRQPDLTVG